MTDWQKVGSTSRQRGKSFERHCAKVLSDFTGHTMWRRTTAGREQSFGDLIPCDNMGVQIPIVYNRNEQHNKPIHLYCECKLRTGRITAGTLNLWIRRCQELMNKKQMEYGLLLIGLSGGVTIIHQIRRSDNVAKIRAAFIHCSSVGDGRI